MNSPGNTPDRSGMDTSQLEQALATRLSAHGIAVPPVLPDTMREVTRGMPAWWRDNGNALYMPEGHAPSAVPFSIHDSGKPPRGALVVALTDALPILQLWGLDSMVFIGAQSSLPHAHLACGDATVYLGGAVRSIHRVSVHARNGGLVFMAADCLIASGVQVMTDDMHTLIDVASNRRINTYGGRIIVREHVWIGLEALVMGGADIGADCVVGARSLVKRAFPAGCLIAGVPARIVRRGVTWDERDIPPVFFTP
uniref:Acyltransferase n=1 Tax=Fundidesulfovibrio putealis TaxID=270496 RepID=A0A7C4AHV3_9BACT